MKTLSAQNQPRMTPDYTENSAIEDVRNELEFLYECENSFWEQRAKIKWKTEGERNTRYFHAIVNKRYNQNLIHNLQKDDGTWTDNEEEIKHLAYSYYSRLFNQDTPDPTCLQELWAFPIPEIDDNDQAKLVSPLSVEEIAQAVFSLPKDSAPGSDGFHANFYQQNWELVKPDVVATVNNFWHSERLLSSFNKTIITLIPKVDKPSNLTDLRPISLCNVIYKIISKVLANRLKPILQKLIALNQSAFLQGRLISDNILLAGDLMNQIHLSRAGRKKLAAFKVDFAKAFDKISWDFIAATMERMKFREK